MLNVSPRNRISDVSILPFANLNSLEQNRTFFIFILFYIIYIKLLNIFIERELRGDFSSMELYVEDAVLHELFSATMLTTFHSS